MATCTLNKTSTITMILLVSATATMFVLVFMHLKYAKHATKHVAVCTGCSNKPGMLPVMDPLHNIEQTYTNLALLEDHMLPGKTCEDCCLKHFRMISGLLDEAISLDTKDKYRHILVVATVDIRKIENAFFTGSIDTAETAKQLRALRKKLTPYLKERYNKSYAPPVDGMGCGGGAIGAACSAKKL
jgi:hypothetical protein